jgi:hypothetical protein
MVQMQRAKAKKAKGQRIQTYKAGLTKDTERKSKAYKAKLTKHSKGGQLPQSGLGGVQMFMLFMLFTY